MCLLHCIIPYAIQVCKKTSPCWKGERIFLQSWVLRTKGCLQSFQGSWYSPSHVLIISVIKTSELCNRSLQNFPQNHTVSNQLNLERVSLCSHPLCLWTLLFCFRWPNTGILSGTMFTSILFMFRTVPLAPWCLYIPCAYTDSAVQSRKDW